MTELNIVIPMAGVGQRFKDAGYNKPKPFIDVLGKPMIKHVLENLTPSITAHRHLLVFPESYLVAFTEDLKTVQEGTLCAITSGLTEGAACTILHARSQIEPSFPLLIANSDQLVDIDIQEFLDDSETRNLDGNILTFQDKDPKWSYAKLGEDGLVESVKEKSVISPHATVGVYWFRRAQWFFDAAIDMICRNDRVKNEFYVCPAFNYGIRNGMKVGIFEIDKSQMHGLGTPEDLETYLQLKARS